MDQKVEIIERSDGYSGFFRLERYRLRHRLFAGGMSPDLNRELFERGDAVVVLLYDPQRDQVVLVEQFRIGALQSESGPWLMEAVAGIFEPGESPEMVAGREAQEEAGCQIKRLIPICNYYVSPGGTSEIHHLFCGLVDAIGVGGIHGLPHEGEDIRVHVIGLAQAMEWVASGRIISAAPIIALQWLTLNHQQLVSPVADQE